VHLVGFTIEIYHGARHYERQSCGVILHFSFSILKHCAPFWNLSYFLQLKLHTTDAYVCMCFRPVLFPVKHLFVISTVVS